MHDSVRSFLSGHDLLLVVAAPAEARAVIAALAPNLPADPPLWTPVRLRPQLQLVRSGVGKANAAGATAAALATARFGAVLSVGIAGALPNSSLQLLQPILATQCVFADEGIALSPANPGDSEGFRDIAAAGFPPFSQGTCSAQTSDALAHALLAHETGNISRGSIATVSTCSGTDRLARDIERRTGAIAEAMEGAAVAVSAQRLNVPFGELRVISNTTGDRTRQTWDLAGSLRELGAVLGRILGEPVVSPRS